MGRSPEALEQFRLAKAFAAQGWREQAVEGYRQVISLDPDFAEAHVNLGILLGQMGEAHAGQAIGCLRRGIDLSPQSARAHYNLGVALTRQSGQLDEAIAALERAVAIDPSHRNSLRALSVVWRRKGDRLRAAGYERSHRELLSGDGSRAVSREAGRRDPGRGASAAGRQVPLLRIRFVR